MHDDHWTNRKTWIGGGSMMIRGASVEMGYCHYKQMSGPKNSTGWDCILKMQHAPKKKTTRVA